MCHTILKPAPQAPSPALPRKWSGGLLRSFRCAFSGIAHLLRTERNAQIHLVATVLVTALGAWLGLERGDWCWLVLAMAGVWVAEAFNTALEVLADRITNERDEAIRVAKDAAAGATLLATLAAVVIGLLVLGPPLWERLFTATKPGGLGHITSCANKAVCLFPRP